MLLIIKAQRAAASIAQANASRDAKAQQIAEQIARSTILLNDSIGDHCNLLIRISNATSEQGSVYLNELKNIYIFFLNLTGEESTLQIAEITEAIRLRCILICTNGGMYDWATDASDNWLLPHSTLNLEEISDTFSGLDADIEGGPGSKNKKRSHDDSNSSYKSLSKKCRRSSNVSTLVQSQHDKRVDLTSRYYTQHDMTNAEQSTEELVSSNVELEALTILFATQLEAAVATAVKIRELKTLYPVPFTYSVQISQGNQVRVNTPLGQDVDLDIIQLIEAKHSNKTLFNILNPDVQEEVQTSNLQDMRRTVFPPESTHTSSNSSSSSSSSDSISSSSI